MRCTGLVGFTRSTPEGGMVHRGRAMARVSRRPGRAAQSPQKRHPRRPPRAPRVCRATALLAALVALAGLLPAAAVMQVRTYAPPAPGNTYVLRLTGGAGTDRVLDNRGATAGGAPVVTAEETDEVHQHWHVVDTGAGGGYYQLRNAHSGLCLEIPGADTTWDGAAVTQYRCDPNYRNQPNQLWQLKLIYGEPDRFTIENRRSGKSLQVLDDDVTVVQSSQVDGWVAIPIPQTATAAWVDLCQHAEFVGCQTFTGAAAIRALGAQGVGNDQVSSVRTGGGATVVLYEHDDYRGACQAIGGEVRFLGDTIIGNDRASSAKLDRGGCFNDATAWLATDRFAVPSARTVSKTYTCPAGRTVGVQGEFHEVFTNTSDDMVSAALGGGGYGSPSVTINFHNWAVETRQAGANVACHDGYLYVDSDEIPAIPAGHAYTDLGRMGADGWGRTVQVRRGGGWEPRTAQGRGDFGDEVLLQPVNIQADKQAIEFKFEGRGFEVIGRKSPGLGGLETIVTVELNDAGTVTTKNPRASTTAAWPRTQEVLLSYSYDTKVRPYTVKVYGEVNFAVAVDAIRIKP